MRKRGKERNGDGVVYLPRTADRVLMWKALGSSGSPWGFSVYTMWTPVLDSETPPPFAPAMTISTTPQPPTRKTRGEGGGNGGSNDFYARGVALL